MGITESKENLITSITLMVDVEYTACQLAMSSGDKVIKKVLNGPVAD